MLLCSTGATSYSDWAWAVQEWTVLRDWASAASDVEECSISLALWYRALLLPEGSPVGIGAGSQALVRLVEHWQP